MRIFLLESRRFLDGMKRLKSPVGLHTVIPRFRVDRADQFVVPVARDLLRQYLNSLSFSAVSK